MATAEKQQDLSEIDLEKLKEEKKISEDKLKIIEASIKGLKITEEELKATKPVEKEEPRLELEKDEKAILVMEFEDNLPEWVDKPWMYIKPKKRSQIESWLDSWSAVLLDYTETFVIHIINVNDIRTTYPFANKKIRKELSIEQIRDVVDYLENQGFADWVKDKTGFFEVLFAKIFGKPLTNKVRAKITWKTKEEFAEDLLDWMIETGRVVEVHSLYDLTQFDKEWSTLPADDLAEVCEILVEKNAATWLNKDKTIIAFNATRVY